MEVGSISWLEAEPLTLQRERELMAKVAPGMDWVDVECGGWRGAAPEWPFPRTMPEGLRSITGGKCLELEVVCNQAFPVVPPSLFPLDPLPPLDRRVDHSWHLNGDGSLCLLRTPYDWVPGSSASDLVVKASGWFIEYVLREQGCLESMSEAGFHATSELDEVVARCYRTRSNS